MQKDSIERIRSATFPIARKGYEKREVERFLSKVADWLEAGGGDQARSDLVKRELERLGEKTTSILASAEGIAEELRSEAEQEATSTLNRAREHAAAARTSADEYSARTRAAADQYAEKVRGEADKEGQDARARAAQEGRHTIAEAQAKAKRIVDEGVKRRQDLETVISDLVSRRDAVLSDVEQLASQLEAAASRHTTLPGADHLAAPSELDPEERAETGARARARERRPPQGKQVGT